MWIVRIALRAPYTFTVLALLLLLGGGLAARKMPKDIFPAVNIPVVAVIWTYGGLPAQEMERRLTTVSERALTTTVGNIAHLESHSFNGIAVIKVFLQPGTKVEGAVAEVASSCQTILKSLPPGATPPNVVAYNAANVPVLQLSVGGAEFSEQQLYDYAVNFIRTQLATIRGASIPLPYGGKARAVCVDLDPPRLASRGLSPSDVSEAIGAQSVVLPGGTARIGRREYSVVLNGSTDTIAALNDLPVKQVNGATVFLRDVAHVRDGYTPQVSMVLADGVKGALLPVIKSGGASTLDVVSGVRAAFDHVRATLPPALEIRPLFDQSVFVRAALAGVGREAAIAGTLTAAMILLFLGSWRSTLVVIVSIPLSISASLLCLHLLGQTVNLQTLGGLALAVGILVDDATVEIENTHRNLALGKGIVDAILDGAAQIAKPAFVATACICVAFAPIFALGGVSFFLFSPLAMAVVFAMAASYLLSRTVVPTLMNFLLPAEERRREAAPVGPPGWFARVHQRFNAGFEALRRFYLDRLEWALDHGRLVAAVALGAVAVSLAALGPFLGQDFFPPVDAGQIRLHVRAPTGTRIEETQRVFREVEGVIRGIIPPDELGLVLANIGLPLNLNIALSDTATIGSADGEILVSLDPRRHGSTFGYLAELRRELAARFPGHTFFTQPADIVGQILNAGLPAPIDVQVVGHDAAANLRIAQDLRRRIAQVPGAVDVDVHQVANGPTLRVNVDRTMAAQIGLTERAVADNLLVSLSGSGQTAPNFWVNPQTGVSYPIVVQTPPSRIGSVGDINETPVALAGSPIPQLVGNLASVAHAATPVVVSHYNVQPVIDVYASVQDRDLGSVARGVERVLDEARPHLPRGTTLALRGQVTSMRSAMLELFVGLGFAVALIYLLLVVNFQSWLDPFIIITALPGAVAGIVWMLFLTGTTLSIPALMGAIMCVGVATSNSILVVTFANEQQLDAGLDARAAAGAAGSSRLRPVLMTATAMILGMLPMALGLGDGGEQNAPLGRAVIGGLLVATFFTLFFVPVVFRLLKGSAKRRELHPRLREPGDDHPEIRVPAPTEAGTR